MSKSVMYLLQTSDIMRVHGGDNVGALLPHDAVQDLRAQRRLRGQIHPIQGVLNNISCRKGYLMQAVSLRPTCIPMPG